MITTGNHVYRHRDAYEFLDRTDRVIRPANYMTGNPGRGSTVVSVGDRRVGVVNLSGSVQLKVARPTPSRRPTRSLERLAGEVDAVIVDFHAEVTSEKIAMGWHLDGRVAAVLGTHTHVPDRGRPGAAGRHGVHHRCRDDRVPSRGDRGAAGAGARVLPYRRCR